MPKKQYAELKKKKGPSCRIPHLGTRGFHMCSLTGPYLGHIVFVTLKSRLSMVYV